MTPEIQKKINRVAHHCIFRGDVEVIVDIAIAAERERCARVCEQIGKDIVCPEECAAAIREEPSDG